MKCCIFPNIKFNSAIGKYYCNKCGKVFAICEVCKNKNTIDCKDCSERDDLIYRFELKV